MKLLVADKMHPLVLEELRQIADECRVEPGLKAEDLPDAIGDADVLIVRSTKVTAQTVEAASRLGLIIRAGAGVNTIDLAAASRRGIAVCNCPGKNAIAVAELAVALMLAWDRRIPCGVAALREGRWEKGKFSSATGFRGRKVGIIGLGSIGMGVIERLRGFDVELHAWSRSLTPDRAELLGVKFAATPEEVARDCSVVSVHLALTEQTRELLGDEFFERLEPGDIFVNTCRAEVVQKEALKRALDRGVLVGTDVFHDEPSGKSEPFIDEIAQHPNLYGTHHVGASTEESELATGGEASRIVKAFVEGLPLPNCVNVRETPKGSFCLFVRHEDRVGVLAGVFKALKEGGVSVQEMENTVFVGEEGASARIVCDRCPTSETLAAIEASSGVYAARLSS